MQVSLLTYNLCFDKALKDLDKVIMMENPDIITVQEIETAEEVLSKVEKLGYILADYSNSFFKHKKIYGIATFYNQKKLIFNQSRSVNLPRSISEILLYILRGGNKPRTVLITEFFTKDKKPFTVYNLHITPWGTNAARVKQIKGTFQNLDINKDPIIVAGDFNFPYGRKQFEMLTRKYNLKEATDNILFTMQSKFLKIIPVFLKCDYILYQNLQLVETKKINVRFSDHFPIISNFEI